MQVLSNVATALCTSYVECERMSIVKPEAPGAFPFFRRESLSAMWWAVMGSEYPGPE